jgi:hypothetical protein
MVGFRKFFDAVPLAALYPTFVCAHSACSENLADVLFGGLSGTISGGYGNSGANLSCQQRPGHWRPAICNGPSATVEYGY